MITIINAPEEPKAVYFKDLGVGSSFLYRNYKYIKINNNPRDNTIQVEVDIGDYSNLLCSMDYQYPISPIDITLKVTCNVKA